MVMALPEVWETRLRQVLAERSNPDLVTDLEAGTLSDQDRETQLRAHLVGASDQQAGEALQITDQGLLMEIAAGW